MFKRRLILLVLLSLLNGCKIGEIARIEKDYKSQEDTYTEKDGWKSVSDF